MLRRVRTRYLGRAINRAGRRYFAAVMTLELEERGHSVSTDLALEGATSARDRPSALELAVVLKNVNRRCRGSSRSINNWPGPSDLDVRRRHGRFRGNVRPLLGVTRVLCPN